MIGECAATDNHIFRHDKMREALLSETSLKEIALYIVQQGLSDWRVYAVFFLLNLVSGAIGAYLSSYIGERGKIAAIKADFDEIIRQLKKTTKISEQIRSAVSHADWAMREWKTIRRTKLEELVNHAMSVKDWSKNMLSEYGNIVENKGGIFPDFPADKSLTICVLYFSDTQTQLTQKCESLLVESANMYSLISEARKQSREKNRLVPPAEFGWDKQHTILAKTADEIKTEAAKIMKDICGQNDQERTDSILAGGS